ncbi:unnamed protein product [Brassica oleracea]
MDLALVCQNYDFRAFFSTPSFGPRLGLLDPGQPSSGTTEEEGLVFIIGFSPNSATTPAASSARRDL